MFQKDFVGGAEFPADASNFVLKQVAEGFDEGKRHFLGQAADVVVGFDGGGGTLDGYGFDDVGVQSALDEVGYFAVGFGGLELLGFFGKDGDELAADAFALFFGVGDACELGQEAVGGVHADDAQT